MLVGALVSARYPWLQMSALAVQAKGPEEDVVSHAEIHLPD